MIFALAAAVVALVLHAYIWLRTRVRNALIKVLSAGPVPAHIAFVMDGNRRYARARHQHVAEGHSAGFNALERMLEICLRMHVRCVTVYAFALENFKRSPEEVDALMDLAEAKLDELCKQGQLLDEYGVRLNVIGRTELLPERVQAAVRKAEDMTRHNDRAILNLCMPYGSRDEIAMAVTDVVRDAVRDDLPPSDISEEAVTAHLMTTRAGSPPLDIIVRSSGVKRLSDFMLWQCCDDTQIHFRKTYWPDFGLWDLVPIILDYQRKVWSRASQSARACVPR